MDIYMSLGCVIFSPAQLRHHIDRNTSCHSPHPYLKFCPQSLTNRVMLEQKNNQTKRNLNIHIAFSKKYFGGYNLASSTSKHTLIPLLHVYTLLYCFISKSFVVIEMPPPKISPLLLSQCWKKVYNTCLSLACNMSCMNALSSSLFSC